jgi:hypothetical protein
MLVILSQKQLHLPCKVCFNHFQSPFTPEWLSGFFFSQSIPKERDRKKKNRTGTKLKMVWLWKGVMIA